MATIAQDPSFTSGRQTVRFVGSIARSDLASKQLFSVPAGAILLGIHVVSPAASNAGTSASISVGKSGGSGAEFLDTFDVKGATGSGAQYPSGPAFSLFATPNRPATIVTGIYTEAGGASNTGGPWIVMLEALVA